MLGGGQQDSEVDGSVCIRSASLLNINSEHFINVKSNVYLLWEILHYRLISK